MTNEYPIKLGEIDYFHLYISYMKNIITDPHADTTIHHYKRPMMFLLRESTYQDKEIYTRVIVDNEEVAIHGFLIAGVVTIFAENGKLEEDVLEEVFREYIRPRIKKEIMI